jgi:hypothetical protein
MMSCFTSCSLLHKDKRLEQLATDPSLGHSYDTLSSATLIATKWFKRKGSSQIYSRTIASTCETFSFLVILFHDYDA